MYIAVLPFLRQDTVAVRRCGIMGPKSPTGEAGIEQLRCLHLIQPDLWAFVPLTSTLLLRKHVLI